MVNAWTLTDRRTAGEVPYPRRCGARTRSEQSKKRSVNQEMEETKAALALRLVRWNKEVPPEDLELRQALQTEELTILEWTDPPCSIYPVHTHPFRQVHVVLTGHLRIGLPESAEEIILNPGDRLDLPPDTPHWEDVDASQATRYLVATPTNHNHTALNHSSARSGNGK